MPFKKGESANPKGRPVLPPEIQARTAKIRRLTNAQISEIGTLIVEGNREQLEAIRADPNSTVLEVWMATIASNGIRKGDAQAFSCLLDRLAGKVREDINLTIHPKPLIIQRLNGTEVILGTEQDLLTNDSKE